MKRDLFLLAAVSVLGIAVVDHGYCTESAEDAKTMAQPAAQSTPASKAASTSTKEAAVPEKPLIAGKVLETMNSGGYTYMLLEKDGRKGWVAVPTMKVIVGQEVQLNPGMEMGQFVSKTLKRTFEQIVFTTAPATKEKPQLSPKSIAIGNSSTLPPGHSPVPGQSGTAATAATAAPLAGKVVETMDSGGYSYICLEKDGKKTWVAVPVMMVQVGDEMELLPGAAMPNFASKGLNRTFESIIFSGGPVRK
jgi:hypothetical protein